MYENDIANINWDFEMKTENPELILYHMHRKIGKIKGEYMNSQLKKRHVLSPLDELGYNTST